MIVYHCTRKRNLDSIRKEGINPPSFWGHFGTALTYYRAWDDAIILAVETDEYRFTVNMDNAKMQRKNKIIKKLPTTDDLISGLRLFKGVVCQEIIYDYQIVEEADFDRLYNESLSEIA
jgi:hypothetical protein